MYYNRSLWLLITCLMLCLPHGNAQSDLLDTGIELYNNERFDEAIAYFENLKKGRQASYELHFNLGTAYLANGDIGEAIYHIEMAGMMSSDREVEEQLAVARSLIEDDIPYFSDFFLVRWYRTLAMGPGSNAWATSALVFFIGLIIIMYLKWIVHKEIRGWSYLWPGFLLLTLVSLWLSVQSRSMQLQRTPAIVLEDARLYEASDERSLEIRKVSEGIKVLVLDEIEEWRKVQLPDKEVGWMNGQGLGILEP